jgi:hypothetical protein
LGNRISTFAQASLDQDLAFYAYFTLPSVAVMTGACHNA